MSRKQNLQQKEEWPLSNITSKNSSGKKILIVDDEKEIRELIKETLTIDEFDVVEAESGDLAWQIVQEQNPDLVLMDVVMPGNLNGFEVCRKIKLNNNTKNIPILFLTAFPVKENQKCEVCNEHFFYKPFSPIKLVNKIYDVLNIEN